MLYFAADCGVPNMNMSITLNYIYNSTLKGSVLILICENDTISADERILHVTCQSNGSWIPDPAQFTCSSFTTVPSGTEQSLIYLSSYTSGINGTIIATSCMYNLIIVPPSHVMNYILCGYCLLHTTQRLKTTLVLIKQFLAVCLGC